MPVLFAREWGGDGEIPLVVLHGLLGSSRNWARAGAELAALRRAIGLDLRNHGESGGGAASSMDDLVDDVMATVSERAVLVGHSLGGKVGMRLACRAPERVERLVIVDIAQRSYPSRAHQLAAMRDLDLAALGSRRAADEALAEAIPDRAGRAFLLTNLARTDAGFAWRIDLDALTASLDVMRSAPLQEGDRYDGPVLWIRGAQSSYTSDEDRAVMRGHFPQLREEMLDTGHNPHVEAREEFVAAVAEFLR